MEIIKKQPRKDEHPYIPELEALSRGGRISRREFLRHATLLGMSLSGAGAFLAACQPSATTEAPTTAPTALPTTLAPTTTPVGGIKRGGLLRYAMQVIRIDHPARFSWVYDSNVMRNTLEYLTLTDWDNVTHPYLLERWNASDDLKTWTLYLRQGIKWNNGDDFTADDVVFTMNEWLNPDVGSSILGLMSYLNAEGIEKVDNYTIRLHLDRPQIAVPEHLYHYPAQILNSRTFEGDITARPVGTGPYTLEEHSVGERAVFRAREDYWQTGADGEPLPYLDGITYIDLGQEETAAVSAFQSGSVDTFYEPSPQAWQTFKDDPAAAVDAVATSRTRVLRMRVDREPWTDNRVRLALKLCQDREKILRLAYYGQGVIGQDHHVAPIHPEYAPVETPQYDPDRAKALLAEAGYPDGLDIQLAVASGWTDVVSYAQVLMEDAAPAGFRITLDTMPASQYWDVWTEVDLGITPWGHRPLAVMMLPLAYICDDRGAPVPWNETRWCDEEFSTLLDQAEGTLDVEARRQIMARIETIQQERGSVGISYWMNTWTIASKKFKGIRAHPATYDLLNEVWYDPDA